MPYPTARLPKHYHTIVAMPDIKARILKKKKRIGIRCNNDLQNGSISKFWITGCILVHPKAVGVEIKPRAGPIKFLHTKVGTRKGNRKGTNVLENYCLKQGRNPHWGLVINLKGHKIMK